MNVGLKENVVPPNVAPLGRFDAEYVSGSPFPSVALNWNVSVEFSATDLFPIVLSTGATFTVAVFTVTETPEESFLFPAASLASAVRVYVPSDIPDHVAENGDDVTSEPVCTPSTR